jgi:plasmid stability protein
MPPVPDLTPEEIAAVLAARRQRAVEDELPASLTARLDREVAARVDAELAARAGGGQQPQPQPQPIVVKQKEKSTDGRVVGVVSLVTGIPMMGIVEGTTHGSLAGAAIVMGGIVLVNMAGALGRRKHQP